MLIWDTEEIKLGPSPVVEGAEEDNRPQRRMVGNGIQFQTEGVQNKEGEFKF